jgi:hypothetical protein
MRAPLTAQAAIRRPRARQNERTPTIASPRPLPRADFHRYAGGTPAQALAIQRAPRFPARTRPGSGWQAAKPGKTIVRLTGSAPGTTLPGMSSAGMVFLATVASESGVRHRRISLPLIPDLVDGRKYFLPGDCRRRPARNCARCAGRMPARCSPPARSNRIARLAGHDPAGNSRMNWCGRWARLDSPAWPLRHRGRGQPHRWQCASTGINRQAVKTD